jgi:glycosyltransferase involved in cell wall biosynthesis
VRTRKLLVIGPEPPPWTGMEVSTLALLEELRRGGIAVSRVNTADPEDELTNRGRWTARNAWLALRHVAAALRRSLDPDVAAVYVPISQERPAFYRDALFLLGARLARKPIVVHLHGGAFADFYESEPAPMRALIRRTVGRAALGIVLSEQLRPSLECVLPPERVKPVLIGVDVETATGRAPEQASEQVRVLFLSTLMEEKGLYVFIEAVARAREERPDVRAEIAGTWFGRDTEPKARALVESLGIAEAVTFHGVVSGADKTRLLASCDIFCLPSFYWLEGTPSVVIEAMAAGLPVVATRWRGIPDLVIEGETAILVDRAEPQPVADALVALAADPELRRRLGEAGRRLYGAQFTRAAFGERALAVLRPLLEGAR